MGTIAAGFSMSLDGFIAGTKDDVQRLFAWMSLGETDLISDTFGRKDEIAAEIQKATLLDRAATLVDVGNVAAFVASNQARTLTSTYVNISCGALVD